MYSSDVEVAYTVVAYEVVWGPSVSNFGVQFGFEEFYKQQYQRPSNRLFQTGTFSTGIAVVLHNLKT